MRRAGAGLALVMGLALWLSGLAAAGALAGSAVELRYDGAHIDKSSLELALDSAEGPVRAAAYGLSNWSGRRVAWAAGDIELVAGGQMLYGHLALEPGECALRLDAARALMGADDVLGRTVVVAGRQMVIRGVYRHGQGDVIAPWRAACGVQLNHLMAGSAAWPLGDSARHALALGQAMGLADPDQVLDMPLLRQLALTLSALPGWALAISLVARQLKAMGEGHRLLRLGALALSAAALAWALGWGAPPSYLLPTRWSDFAFWQRLWSGLGGRVADTLAARHWDLDRARLEGLYLAALMGVAGAHLVAAGFGRLTKGRTKA